MDTNIILLIKAIIISIVEGITEFVPVSSTGHMILVGDLIGFKGDFENLFMVVIQLGAILAIVVLYWKKFWSSLIEFFKRKGSGFKLWTSILIAFLPAAVFGALFDDKIEEILFGSKPVAIALIVGAILMIIIEKKYRNTYKTRTIDDVSYKQALFIGFAQCFAMWPGMSRSASTIMGGWLAGLSTVAAAEFSFFLAIPTMVGASGYKLIKGGMALSSGEIITLIIGFIVAFGVALIVVDKFIGYLKKKPMKGFAVYRLFIGVLILGLIYAGYLSA